MIYNSFLSRDPASAWAQSNLADRNQDYCGRCEGTTKKASSTLADPKSWTSRKVETQRGWRPGSSGSRAGQSACGVVLDRPAKDSTDLVEPEVPLGAARDVEGGGGQKKSMGGGGGASPGQEPTEKGVRVREGGRD